MQMVAMLAPHGFAPSEVWSWTLADYRVVVDTLNEVNKPEDDGKPPAPSIEEFRSMKSWYMERENARVAAEREALENAK